MKDKTCGLNPTLPSSFILFGYHRIDDHGRFLGCRKQINPLDCDGFWFVCKAHSPVHIGICAGGCHAADGPKDKQDVDLFVSDSLTSSTGNILVWQYRNQAAIPSMARVGHPAGFQINPVQSLTFWKRRYIYLEKCHGGLAPVLPAGVSKWALIINPAMFRKDRSQQPE